MEISKEDIKCVHKLSGELETDQEKAMFEVGLLLDEDLYELYQDYKTIWECYPTPFLPLNKELSAKRIREQFSVPSKSSRSIFSTKIKAMLVAVVIMLGFGFYFFMLDKEESRFTNHIIALEGQRKQVTLPDGSKITVNSGSELKYPEHFDEDLREVWIEGEAYFDVSRDINRPFKVHANDFFVQVLGTTFNVNTKGKQRRVSLKSGKVHVKLGNSGDVIQLNPNEELFWDVETGEMIKRTFDVSKTMAWKDNILLLENTTLKDAIVSINEFYGVDFVITDSILANKNISGAFEDQDLAKFIQTLEFIADVEITNISQKKFSIAPRDEN